VKYVESNFTTMKIIKLTAVLVLSVLMFSCKKDDPEPDKVTPVVGAWHDMLGEDVAYFHVAGRGLVCVVTDLDINDDALYEGTLYVYIRYSAGNTKSYYNVPGDVPGIGTAGEPEASDGMYGFQVQEKPSASPQVYLHARALIIPKDANLPGTLDMTDYVEVAGYFGLTD
jgi:hypothetical protein